MMGCRARREVIAARNADVCVAVVEFRADARRLKRAMEERLGHFGLKLDLEKTRASEFGPAGHARRRSRVPGKRPIFNFLGFTRHGPTTRTSHFMVLRLISAKLQVAKPELRRSMHPRVPE